MATICARSLLQRLFSTQAKGAGSYGFVQSSLLGGVSRKPLIIEARVNEFAPRTASNPHVPFTPQEIARDARECFEAGASIVHFHSRADDGAPANSTERFKETILAIREECESVLVHPTLGYVTMGPKEERMEHMRALCADPRSRPDIAPVDMGTTNVDRWNPVTKSFETKNQVYQNTTETLEYFTRSMVDLRCKVYSVAWTIGFTRYIAAFLEAGILPAPAYVCFCLTDGMVLSGHSGTIAGLAAHVDNIPADANVEWTVCNFGGNLFPVAAYAMARGGHISVGLGDYPYPELGGQPRNAEIIRAMVDLARAVGRPVATVRETKEILGM